LSKGFKSPNGHIHQLAQKVQGNMTFHAALSRAFRQPARGSGSLSGSMLVPADEHRSKLWLYTVTIMQRNKPLAVVDKTLVSQGALSHLPFLRAPPTVGNIFAAEAVS